jgi:cytidylate kinase
MPEFSENSTCDVLTIDGPSGAGKGSIAQLVSKNLGWHLLDSGALYRLTALSALKKGVSLEDESLLAQIASKLEVEFKPSGFGEPVQVILSGENVTNELRLETTGNNASKIAPLAEVRAALLQRQRDFAMPPGLVADGRDMGTVVFPYAKYKIFLSASAQTRAERRYKQLKDKGEDVKILPLLKEIEERDERDMGRKNAPLKPAIDALLIDSTGFSIEEVLNKVIEFIESKP